MDDNESWQKATRAYQQSLGLQIGAMRTASNWIGGAHIHRHRKGDEGAKDSDFGRWTWSVSGVR